MTYRPVSVVVLLDVAPGSRLWGWSRFVVGRFPLARVPGLRFYKVLGSGHEAGFGLRPSASRQGLFCHFDDERSADQFLQGSALMAAYRRHAREFFQVKLKAYACRGAWAGMALPLSADKPATGVVAALTRASIRPTAALPFWRHAPPSEAALSGAQGCRLAAGLGEAPLFRQATFTLWDNADCMDAYARSGAHLAAIKAAQAHGFFSESMFVRFVPLEAQGVWKGQRFA